MPRQPPGRRILLVANLEQTPQRVEIWGAWGARSRDAGPHAVHVLEFRPGNFISFFPYCRGAPSRVRRAALKNHADR